MGEGEDEPLPAAASDEELARRRAHYGMDRARTQKSSVWPAALGGGERKDLLDPMRNQPEKISELLSRWG